MADIKKHLKKYLKKAAVGLYKLMYRFLPVDKKMIVFDSSIGLNYTGSPRAIYEEMVDKGLDNEYRCVWFFQSN